MSRHTCQTTHHEAPVEVAMGYDRALDYVFCTVKNYDGEVIYSNLADPSAGTTCQSVDYYRGVLAELGIFGLPEEMFTEVTADQFHRVGNREVPHSYVTPDRCVCGDPRPCPHIDPVRCDAPDCGHLEEDHEAYGGCMVAGCICRHFISHALFDFKLRHGGRTFDEWCDGADVDGLQALIYAARDVVAKCKRTIEVNALEIALRPFRDAPPPEDYAPQCAYCLQSKEHTEVMGLVAGISDPFCCGGPLISDTQSGKP